MVPFDEAGRRMNVSSVGVLYAYGRLPLSGMQADHCGSVSAAGLRVRSTLGRQASWHFLSALWLRALETDGND